MLPPTRVAELIVAVAPLFVQRSWLHAEVLLIGAILTLGPCTVAIVLCIMGDARTAAHECLPYPQPCDMVPAYG